MLMLQLKPRYSFQASTLTLGVNSAMYPNQFIHENQILDGSREVFLDHPPNQNIYYVNVDGLGRIWMV